MRTGPRSTIETIVRAAADLSGMRVPPFPFTSRRSGVADPWTRPLRSSAPSPIRRTTKHGWARMGEARTRLSLALLGDFQARFEPGVPLRLRTRKTQALLAYLARVPGQPHSRDKLAALLWGDRTPNQARGRLRETLFALRQALRPGDPACLDGGGEVVALKADMVDVDVLSFQRLVHDGSPQALEEAVRLYRGDFL